jgi:hypothetical protein
MDRILGLVPVPGARTRLLLNCVVVVVRTVLYRGYVPAEDLLRLPRGVRCVALQSFEATAAICLIVVKSSKSSLVHLLGEKTYVTAR